MKNKIIEKLENKFQSFINNEDRDFLLGLVDYVEFVKKLPATNAIIKKLEEKKKADLDKISKAKEKDEKENTAVSSVLLERAEEQSKITMWYAWDGMQGLANFGYDKTAFRNLDVVSLCSRFHKYLVDELELPDAASENFEIDFDENKGVLRINGKVIEFSKTTRQYEVLRAMFQNQKETYKDWQLSEISDILDEEELYEWKKLYNVINEIGKKIATETGIKDFFYTTTQSVMINKKYAPKS